jgi:signal transduction histidine kinase
MLHPYRKISLYTYFIVATLVVSFAGASAVLVRQEAKINESGDRNAAFHVPTIRHVADVKEALLEFETHMLEHATDAQLNSGTEDHDDHLLWSHGNRLLYVIRKELDSIIGLQTAFGGAQFDKTLDKFGKEFSVLALSIEAGAEQSDTIQPQDMPETLRALILSLDQLERLHVIAYAQVNRRIESDIRRRNATVYPIAVGILICGLIGLAYLTRQTRNALGRLEEADRALKVFNQDLEQRVEERTAELRGAQDQLVRKERLAAVGQVTGTVSHELRNPLGAIRSGIDAMKKFHESADPRMARIIALLDRSERRCNKVIADLLDFTRVRELELHPTRVDDWLGALLDEQNLPPQVTLRRQLRSGVELPLDRDRIERALRNVIENACHAMEATAERDGGAEEHHLTVATRAAEGRLEISVADTGVGIAADERAKVFEPLFSTKSFGVGLGLPMVKQTLEQHGGSVEIRGNAERGTEVVLWLQLSESQQGAAA